MRSNVCVNHRTAHLELECRLDTRSAHRHHLDTPSPKAQWVTRECGHLESRYRLNGPFRRLEGSPKLFERSAVGAQLC